MIYLQVLFIYNVCYLNVKHINNDQRRGTHTGTSVGGIEWRVDSSGQNLQSEFLSQECSSSRFAGWNGQGNSTTGIHSQDNSGFLYHPGTEVGSKNWENIQVASQWTSPSLIRTVPKHTKLPWKLQHFEERAGFVWNWAFDYSVVASAGQLWLKAGRSQ